VWAGAVSVLPRPCVFSCYTRGTCRRCAVPAVHCLARGLRRLGRCLGVSAASYPRALPTHNRAPLLTRSPRTIMSSAEAIVSCTAGTTSDTSVRCHTPPLNPKRTLFAALGDAAALSLSLSRHYSPAPLEVITGPPMRACEALPPSCSDATGGAVKDATPVCTPE
jgi:hypothetical protein